MDVIRLWATTFFIISVFSCISQNPTSDTAVISETSKVLLEKKVTFDWSGGTLAAALQKLHSQYGFRFSYSGQQIELEQSPKQAFTEATLGQVMDGLLKKSKYDYLVVGRIVVIVKKKVAPMRPDTLQQAQKVVPQQYPHIYTTSFDLKGLTWYEKQIIYKNFKKELRWARRSSFVQPQDSNKTEAKKKLHAHNALGHRYFVSADIGIQKPLLGYKQRTLMDWKGDIRFKQKANTSGAVSLGFSKVFPHWIVSVGLGYKNIAIETQWIEIRPRRGGADTIQKMAKERYHLWSIPIQGMYYRQKGRLFLGAGISLRPCFIRLQNAYADKFERYYNARVIGDDYVEKTPKMALSTALFGTVGLRLKQRFLSNCTIEYDPFFTPIHKNSCFNLLPHQLGIKLGISYLLGKL